MGACLSSGDGDYSDSMSRRGKPTANVITVDGQLRQYSLPVNVSQVLRSETLSPESVFLCNSDRLRFEDYIPSLKLEEELEEAQIYFMLPASKLRRRLTATEMAALAVKASVALGGAAKRRRSARSRISSVLVVEEESWSDYSEKASRVTAMDAVVSKKKLQRYYSRRAKMAVKSFKNKLSTIDEGSEALD